MIPTPKKKQLPADVQRLAAAYGRYSSAGQRDVSIEQQLRDIRAYAQREGYTIVHEYADHAKSGFKNTGARREFNSMLEAAKTGAFGTIIVWKVDRFGRNREEAAIFKGRLRQYGVRVIYAMEPIPEGSAGVLLEGMLEATAEWYSRNLSENVNRGMTDNAMKCLHNGNKYFGYMRGADNRYAVNPDDAPVVRKIYQLYLEGTGTKTILAWLYQHGITKEGKPFSYDSLLRILRNERYTGVYIWRDIRIEGGMPVIIPRNDWEEVQRQLKTRQKRETNRQVDFLLTGKLFCGHCGTSMVGDSGTSRNGATHYYYSCMQRKHQQGCEKKSVRKEMIETAVVNALLDALTDDAIEHLADLVVKEQKKEMKTSVLTSMKSELVSVRRKITNLNNAIADGIYTASTRDMLLRLESEEKELVSAIAALEFTQGQLLTHERVVYWMHRFTTGDREDHSFRVRLVNIFLNSVYLYDGDNGSRMKILVNTMENEPTVRLDELNDVTPCSDNDASGVHM